MDMSGKKMTSMYKDDDRLPEDEKDYYDYDDDETISPLSPETYPEAFVPIPPDGGFGWVIVFASFMCNCIIDGIVNSYGVLLVELCDYYQAPKSTVSFAGSLLCGVYLMTGPITGALVNSFGCRVVTILGAIFCCCAFIVGSLAPNVEVLIVFYGVMGGIGFGLIYLPSVVIVSYYFEEKRALATGIAVCGSGFGSIIFAPIMENLLRVYDWKSTVLILAGFVLNCAVFGTLMRPLEPVKSLDPPPEPREPLLDRVKAVFSSRRSLENDTFFGSLNIGKKMQRTGSTCDSEIAKSEILLPIDTLKDDLYMHAHRYVERLKANEEAPLPTSAADPVPALLEMDDKIIRSADELSKFKVDTKPQHQNGSTALAVPNSGDSIARSTPNLGEKSCIRGKNMSHRRIQLPHQSVTRRDYSRPLYRKDIFYSGSIYHINRIDKPLSRQSRVGSQAWIGSCALSMTRIPVNKSDHPVAKGLLKYIPKAVKDIFRTMTDVSLFRNSGYALIWVANIFSMIGFYVPLFFLVDYSYHLGIPKDKGSFLLSIMGIMNTISRVLFGWITGLPRVNPLLVNNITIMISGVLTLLLPLCTTYPLMMAYSAAYGLFLGPCISLTSVILCDLLGLDALTNAFGLLTLARGISSAVGPPFAGSLYDATQRYDVPFYMAGGMILLSGIMHCVLHLPYYRDKSEKLREQDEERNR